MQIVNLTQGTPAWHQHRAQHWNASDAPAMMSCSSYKTRSELVRELATGITPEVDAATERRFADGHRFEALARPLAEEIIGEELSPCVGTEGKLSASFDGLTFMNDVGFEHKSLNDRLRAAMVEGCTGADLPLQYQVQMEQQAAVAGCQRILFMATKWTPDGTLLEQRHCWYAPNPELRAQILVGWKLLEKDVAAYAPPKAEPVAAKIQAALPVLRIEASGEITASNLDEFQAVVLERINAVNMDLVTDQDFADGDADGKWLRDVSTKMKEARQRVRSGMQSVDEVLRVLEELEKIATDKAIKIEKKVKTEKDVRKEQIVMKAESDLSAHIAGLNEKLGANYLPPPPRGMFAAVTKGLKSLLSMEDKVRAALAVATAEADALAGRLEANRQHLRQEDGDWIALFADFATVGGKAPEDFQALAALRIGQHRQAEANRLEAERERIRQEEQARAQRAAAAEAARMAAEQARQLEADRARIRQEEQQRADAEAREQLAKANAQAQAGIAQGREAGALPAPLLDDLSATATHVHDSGMAALDAQQAISTAQASSAGAAQTPVPADNGAELTLSELNTMLKEADMPVPVKVTAETLDVLGIPHRKERSSVLVRTSDAHRMAMKLALGFEKFARGLIVPAN